MQTGVDTIAWTAEPMAAGAAAEGMAVPATTGIRRAQKEDEVFPL